MQQAIFERVTSSIAETMLSEGFQGNNPYDVMMRCLKKYGFTKGNKAMEERSLYTDAIGRKFSEQLLTSMRFFIANGIPQETAIKKMLNHYHVGFDQYEFYARKLTDEPTSDTSPALKAVNC